jgi:hypothetical protein
VILSEVKEKYKQQGPKEIRSFCRRHKIKSKTDFNKILFKAFNKYLTSDLFQRRETQVLAVLAVLANLFV